MKITALNATALAAELPAPMRSRGCPGFREYFHTGSERQRITAVEVRTDSELTGLTLLHGDAREWLDGIAAPALAGRDPLALRHCRRAVQEAINASPEPGRQPSRGHLNRLEFALWDLLAKSAGLPLFRLLGGEDPYVEVYAGGGSLCWNPLPELVREAEALLERGFRAIKIKIGHGPAEDAEIVRTLRRACGPDLRIMVDANCAYDLESALRLCPALEAAGVDWLEEPLVYDDPAAWRALRSATSVRIAGGEGFVRLAQVAEALREGILEIFQCDAGGFGLEALLAIGSMTGEAGARLTPHSCNSVIGFLVACHLQRALPNREAQEFETFDNPFVHSIFAETLELRRGCVVLSEAPGLGVSFDPGCLERYRIP